MWKEFLLMGETLEYLESLYDAGLYDELEDCGECLADWTGGVTETIILDRPACPYCGAKPYKSGKTKGQHDIDGNPIVQQKYYCPKCKSSFRRKI